MAYLCGAFIFLAPIRDCLEVFGLWTGIKTPTALAFEAAVG